MSRCVGKHYVDTRVGMNQRWIVAKQSHQTSRWLSLAMCSTGGAIIAGMLMSVFFSSWVVALAAFLGGMGGLFVAAFCWVAGAEYDP